LSDLIEMQMKTGLSKEGIAVATGLDRRTVRDRLADGRMTRAIQKKLRPIMRTLRRTLVSEPANVILEDYRDHKDRYQYPDDRDLLRFIDNNLVIVPRILQQVRSERSVQRTATMKIDWKDYPDISDILQRKAEGRLDLHARSFAEKLDALDALRERAAPLRAARMGRSRIETAAPTTAASQEAQQHFTP
jgi:hypothetical protein